MFNQFTYKEYKKFLSILKRGRKNLVFSDLRFNETPSSFYILRHDVDLSLSAARKMALFEAQLGIRATYFLLLSCEYYNLLSEKNCEFPAHLISLGHEVGLHYDITAMSKRNGTDLKAKLQLEADILSDLSGKQVRSIAMHNPSIYGKALFYVTISSSMHMTLDLQKR